MGWRDVTHIEKSQPTLHTLKNKYNTMEASALDDAVKGGSIHRS